MVKIVIFQKIISRKLLGIDGKYFSTRFITSRPFWKKNMNCLLRDTYTKGEPRNVMVFVKQFRPAIYYNRILPQDRQQKVIDTTKYPADLGIALEMCAGIIDKKKPVEEIAKEEVLEECGYDVPLEKLQRITSYRAGVGVQGDLQTLFYCEVTDDMRTEQGGGVDDEIIEVVEKSIPEVEAMVSSAGPIPSPPSCLFALMWFLHYKADQFRK